jgi:uncharacterized OsmC-like protein
VYLLDVEVAAGERTVAHGALWDGLLNASPEDTNDGPSPVEALLAGVAGCFVRNLRWMADGAHVTFDHIGLRLAAERDDDPPAIREVRLEVRLETDAAGARVAAIVERALRSGTITRTVARAVDLRFELWINDQRWAIDLTTVGLPARGPAGPRPVSSAGLERHPIGLSRPR